MKMGNLSTKMVVTLFVTLVLFAMSCTQPGAQYDEEAAKAAIAKLHDQEMAAYSAGDINAIENLFTDDIKIMPPNKPAVTGKAALRTWAENLYSMFNIQGEYTSSDLTLAGDWAFERLTFNMTRTPVSGGESIQETGKCIHIYKRQADGSWRIAQDIWNMDNPAATTPQVSEK